MPIWAVARQMIAEGIRMKIALVFLALIGAVIVGLPFSVEGDSTLSGAVQSFMAYGFSATAVLLSMLTIFMSRSLSDELVNRQIFLVMTKPVSRWQFVVGKWLGITCLNAVFLVSAGLTIYGMIHYIRISHGSGAGEAERSSERKALAEEVLVARHALRVVLPDFSKTAEREFDRNVEEGAYAGIPDFNVEAEKARLRKKHEARWRVVPPLSSRVFRFENVLCERSREVFIHLRYKADVVNYAPDEVLRAAWVFGDPANETPEYIVPIRHRVDRFHSIRFPSDAVAADHTLRVEFVNRNPFQGERQFGNVMDFRKSNEVEVLFDVGSFEGNAVRLMVLMMCKLMFLAAVAVLMTTVFSFPVASLGSFTVYVIAGARSFLMEAVDFMGVGSDSMFSSFSAFAGQLIAHVITMAQWVVPDFGYYDGVETLVNGRNVGLVWVLQGVGELVLLKTVIVLGLAVLLFHRREVAEVSV